MLASLHEQCPVPEKSGMDELRSTSGPDSTFRLFSSLILGDRKAIRSIKDLQQ